MNNTQICGDQNETLLDWAFFSFWLLLNSSILGLLVFTYMTAQWTSTRQRKANQRVSNVLAQNQSKISDYANKKEEFGDLYDKVLDKYIEESVMTEFQNKRNSLIRSMRRPTLQRSDSQKAAQAMLQVMVASGVQQDVDRALSLWEITSDATSDEDTLDKHEGRQRRSTSGGQSRNVSLADQRNVRRTRSGPAELVDQETGAEDKRRMVSKTVSGPAQFVDNKLEIIYEL